MEEHGNGLTTAVEVGGSESEPESTTTEDLARTLGATSSPSHQDPTSLSSLTVQPKRENQDKTPADPANNASMFATTFDPGFEACVFSAITLQVRFLFHNL